MTPEQNQAMSTCFACTGFERNPATHVYRSACIDCSARSIARSPLFDAQQDGISGKYRAALDRAFKGDWQTGDSLVRRWAEKIRGVAA